MWAARPTPAVNRGYRDGRAAAGWITRGLPGGRHADRLSRRSAARRRPRQRVRHRAGRQPGATLRREGRRGRPDRRDQRASAGRVPHVDRRAVPSGEPAVGGRRHALHRRHVPRRDPARAIPVGVPEEPDPRPRAWSSRPGSGRIYRVVHETTRRGPRPALSAKTPARSGRGARASERLVARHRAAAARRARRRSVAPAIGRAGHRCPRSAARLHALVDARRARRARAATVLRALADTAPEVRAAAVRVAEPWLGKDGDPVQAAVCAAGRRSRGAGPLAAGAVARRVARSRRVEQAAQLLAQPRPRSVRRRRRRQQPGRHRGSGAGAAAGATRRARGCARPPCRSRRPRRQAGRGGGALDARRRCPPAGRRSAWRWRAAIEFALGTESFGVRTPRRLMLAAAPQPLLGRAHERGEIETVVARLLDGMDWPGKPRKAETVAPLSCRGAAAVRGGQGDLRPAVRGVPSARRARPRRPGAGARRLAVRHRAGRHHGAHRDPRQGRQDVDAAARQLVRRRDRRGPDLRATLVRAHRVGGRRRARARSAGLRARPRAPVDRSGAEGDVAAGRRSAARRP